MGTAERCHPPQWPVTLSDLRSTLFMERPAVRFEQASVRISDDDRMRRACARFLSRLGPRPWQPDPDTRTNRPGRHCALGFEASH